MKRTVVLNVVGLSRSLLGAHTPNLTRLAGTTPTTIQPICPAVTCTMQATFLTGKLPAQHGIIGNGWYFRELSEIFFWRQSNRLIQAEKIWQTGRRRNNAFSCANTFWWFNMASDVDWSITPRPIYCADGRKIPDCYTQPEELRRDLTRRLGPFPLFRFWGPATSIASSAWIAAAAKVVEERYRPTLHLIYLPHLDYCLQKEGPQGDIQQSLREIDTLCGDLISFFEQCGCQIIVLSEYGISSVSRPVHPNRMLREAGLLKVKNDLGREYLDPGASRAFAVADHQIAHVYVRDRADLVPVKSLFEGVPEIEHVIEANEETVWRLDHERAGELVLVAAKGSWFSYYFWLNDALAPDYARTVNIHAKPGYDPCELFFDPKIRFLPLKLAHLALKQRLGLRTLFDVVPLEAALVKGSHGRIPDQRDEWPVLFSTKPMPRPAESVQATDLFQIILDHVFA